MQIPHALPVVVYVGVNVMGGHKPVFIFRSKTEFVDIREKPCGELSRVAVLNISAFVFTKQFHSRRKVDSSQKAQLSAKSLSKR